MNDDKTPKTDEKTEESEVDEKTASKEESSDENTENNGLLSTIAAGPLVTNIILAGLFANFAYLFYEDYNTNPKFSSLLMMIQVCCIVLFFLIRVTPSKVTLDPKDWIIAVVGTALPMLIAPVGAVNEIAILLLLQFFGIFISIVAIISLNNSFGIVPAIRNIKTKGLYSLIRHPIYFGYFISMTCIVLQNFTFLNFMVLVAIIAADIYRIIAEERILSEDSEYELYKMRVKWRLIPFVW